MTPSLKRVKVNGETYAKAVLKETSVEEGTLILPKNIDDDGDDDDVQEEMMSQEDPKNCEKAFFLYEGVTLASQ